METKTEEAKTEEKNYVVIWHYVANHGAMRVKATTPEEAIKQVYCGKDEIAYCVVEEKYCTFLRTEMIE